MALIRLSRWVVVARGAHNRRTLLDPVAFLAIGGAVNSEAVSDFALKHLNLGLVDGQVCHLDIKTMEMNALHWLVYSSCKLSLTNFLNTFSIGQSTVLMEFTEQVIEVKFCTWVSNKDRPIVVIGERLDICLELVDDLREVPGEGKHVSMLLLIELYVNAESSISGVTSLDLGVLFLLHCWHGWEVSPCKRSLSWKAQVGLKSRFQAIGEGLSV